MFLLDQNSREYEAKEDGRAEGKAEGLAEGMQTKALETAAKLKTRGMPIDDVCEITGLTKEEVETL